MSPLEFCRCGSSFFKSRLTRRSGLFERAVENSSVAPIRSFADRKPTQSCRSKREKAKTSWGSFGGFVWKASEVANPEHKILRLKPTARNPRAYKIESQGSKPNLNPRPKALRLNPEFKIRAGHDSQVAVALARFARDM